MLRFLLPFAVFAFINCADKAALTPAADVLETKASIFGDKLPADGCEAHLWLLLASPSSDSRTFMRLPTTATRSLMDKVIQAEVAKQPPGTLWMGSKDVTITYRETGQTATLQCGWGAKQTVQTVELIAVKER